jgi:Ribbon-helix-helix protein, copG family
MISFRLTAEEYERFRELCSTCGTRSVSELARAAINSLLNQPAEVPREALEYRVAELEGRVNMLRLEFRKLRQHGNGNGNAEALEEPTAILPERLSS